jgi:hypothetical protein
MTIFTPLILNTSYSTVGGIGTEPIYSSTVNKLLDAFS